MEPITVQTPGGMGQVRIKNPLWQAGGETETF